MSLDASRWTWQQTVSPATRKLVLLALADHADRDGYCWPSIDQLAERCGIDERGVRRHLAGLVDHDLLVRVKRPRRDDGTLGRWLYRLPLNSDHRTPAPSGPPGTGARQPPGAATRESPGHHRAPVPARNQEREPSLGNRNDEQSEVGLAVGNGHVDCVRCGGTARLWNATGGFEIDCPERTVE